MSADNEDLVGIAMTATIATSQARPQGWIFNPFIDLFFCCGGFFWLIVGLHFYFTGQNPGHLGYENTYLLPLGALFLSNPHLSATIVRLYKKKEVRNKLWVHSYLSLALLIPLACWAVMDPVVMALIIRVYAVLTFDHTLSQNYGVTLMYCYRSSYVLEKYEKLCLKVFYHALIWFAVLRQFTYIEFCPKRNMGYDIPKLGPIPEAFALTAFWIMIASLLGFCGIVVNKALKTKQLLPFPALCLIVTSIAISISSVLLSSVFFIFTPAYFHAIQYLVITTSYNLREQGATKGLTPAGMTRLLFSKTNALYWVVLLAIGWSIFVGIPTVLMHLGMSQSAVATSLFVCVSFHHFFADSALWKFRDANVRKNLVEQS